MAYMERAGVMIIERTQRQTQRLVKPLVRLPVLVRLEMVVQSTPRQLPVVVAYKAALCSRSQPVMPAASLLR